jgi:hypothetical protein
MDIFLSYASEDKATAESITFSLRDRGHTVFLDRDHPTAGESFDQQIERAVNESDIFIFLISPDSIAEGRYTLTELKFARHKWRSPNNRVLSSNGAQNAARTSCKDRYCFQVCWHEILGDW